MPDPNDYLPREISRFVELLQRTNPRKRLVSDKEEVIVVSEQ